MDKRTETSRRRITAAIMAAVTLLWAAGCFCFFQAGFKFHFYYIEQNQLFLNSWDYISEFFARPAWLPSIAGSFMQQFYHYTLGGAAVLTLSLLLLGAVSFKAFGTLFDGRQGRRRAGWAPFIMALVLMSAEARMFTYENAQLASIYSIAAGFIFHIAFSRVRFRSPLPRICLFPFLTVLCWWAAGYGAFVAVILEIIGALTHRRVPAAGLSCAALVLVLLLPARALYRMSAADLLTCPGPGKWINYEASLKVEKVLMYDYVYHRGDYRQVIGMYERAGYRRTKEMSFYYTLSASQLGMLPDKLPLMKEPVVGTTVHLGHAASPTVTRLMCELYWLIGEMTYAERVCMHANNFTLTKRSARLIQRLAEINLVTGDCAAADKYLRMLRKSFIYRQWALDHTPGTMTEEVKAALEARRPFINREPSIHVGDDCRMLLTGLLDSNPENVAALDYLLCTDWLTGRKETFLRDYAAYGPREKPFYKHLLGEKTR